MQEMQRAIEEAANNKAAGEDDIPTSGTEGTWDAATNIPTSVERRRNPSKVANSGDLEDEDQHIQDEIDGNLKLPSQQREIR